MATAAQIPTERQQLARDVRSHGLINTDKNALNKHRKARQRERQLQHSGQDIQDFRSLLASFEKRLTALTFTVEDLVAKVDDCANNR